MARVQPPKIVSDPDTYESLQAYAETRGMQVAGLTRSIHQWFLDQPESTRRRILGQPSDRPGADMAEELARVGVAMVEAGERLQQLGAKPKRKKRRRKK